MDTMNLVFLLLFLAICSGLYLYRKRQNRRILRRGRHTRATVREYRPELTRVGRGASHTLEYPYVEYRTATGETRLARLGYARRETRPFALGEEIEVVEYEGGLYYRAAL